MSKKSIYILSNTILTLIQIIFVIYLYTNNDAEKEMEKQFPSYAVSIISIYITLNISLLSYKQNNITWIGESYIDNNIILAKISVMNRTEHEVSIHNVWNKYFHAIIDQEKDTIVMAGKPFEFNIKLEPKQSPKVIFNAMQYLKKTIKINITFSNSHSFNSKKVIVGVTNSFHSRKEAFNIIKKNIKKIWKENE